MNKKLFITGGAGFIGSNFIRYILNKYPDYEVLNYDKLTYAGNLDNLRDIESDPRYRFVQGDICDSNLLDDIFSKEKFDYVVNFAAETHVDRSISNPNVFVETNILGVSSLLEIVKKYGTGKFLHISTDETYGSINDGSFFEDDKLSPNSPYSASKAGADLLVMAYYKTYGLPVLITRSSNNFGPYQYPEKLIPLFVTNLMEDKKVPLYGTGENVRDWIYVIDNCSGVDTVLHDGELGEIYNIGGGNEKMNIEITRSVLKFFDKNEDWIDHVPDRLGHDLRYSLGIKKVEELGWKPQYDFEKALQETIVWYGKNIEWWKKIKEKSNIN
ncbi:MAG: dTDP-glucose 4,6-dehydratase [Candidatus Pacebacteria bacterium]|nr:dTDP-glucose 4,6-dehydratase [Candidatus Paceibacterota bacterium]